MRHIFRFLFRYQKSYFALAGLSVFHLLISFSRGALTTYFPKYLEGFIPNLGLVAAILALPWALNILSDVLIGDLAEYINKRRLIIFGLILLAIVGIIYYLAQSVWVLVFGLVLYGFAVDLYWIPTNSYLIGISPKKQDSEYYAIFDSLGSLGWTLGPTVAGFIIGSFLPKNLFLFFSTMCLITLLYVLFVMRIPDVKHVKRHSIKKYLLGFLNLRRLKRGAKISLFLTAAATLWDDLLWLITPLYLFSLDLQPAFIGFVLTMLALPYLLFQVPAGFWEDRNGKATIILPALALIGVSLIAFGMFENIIVFLVAAFVLSTCSAFLGPALGGILIDNTTPKEREHTASLRTFLCNIATITGFIAGGLIAEYLGFVQVYYILAAFIILLGFAAHFMHAEDC